MCERGVAARRLRERGSTLVVVILMMLVVSALGTGMVVLSNTNHQIAANERDSERALFASRAGLEYGYHLLQEDLLTPTAVGAPFDASAPSVKGPLDGASFSGRIYSVSAAVQGRVHRITSTGRYNHASRTTEVVVATVPEAFRYGYMAFARVSLHNHSRLAGPSFRIESTIFSNDDVEVPENIGLNGTIVAAGEVSVALGAVLKRDVFANSVKNYGTIEGNVKTLSAVAPVPDDAPNYDLRDDKGKKHVWYNDKRAPGEVRGPGKVKGTKTRHAIRDGEEFRHTIFRRDGKLMADPQVNVLKYIAPPKLDYSAMRREADKYEPTFFGSMSAAMRYLITKKVTETIDGKTVTTIRVGTEDFPEFLYVRGDFTLQLDPDAPFDNPSRGVLVADGFNLEGGIYATGEISLNGPAFDAALHPGPPDWYQFRINALPYCYPAVVAYEEPSEGSIDTWTPEDTPSMDGEGPSFKMSSTTRPHEGFVHLNGVTFSQFETHLHHTRSTDELIRFNGAELGYRIHNCDYFWFSYDPAVRCTAFLALDAGIPRIVSYRELPGGEPSPTPD